MGLVASSEAVLCTSIGAQGPWLEDALFSGSDIGRDAQCGGPGPTRARIRPGPPRWAGKAGAHPAHGSPQSRVLSLRIAREEVVLGVGRGDCHRLASGAAQDVSCCLKKEKHDRCLECKSMDCEFKTCNVNKQYYSERTLVAEAKASTKEAYEKFDDKAMKAAGWGL